MRKLKSKVEIYKLMSTTLVFLSRYQEARKHISGCLTNLSTSQSTYANGRLGGLFLSPMEKVDVGDET